jgi:alpha-L-arabinofuranosidase
MSEKTITINPEPTFSLSPWLYMQFMEPLGVTDSSVEAMWNHMSNDWYPSAVKVTRELGPTLMRWGGCLSSYYRWKEGVGPRNKRKPYYNILWKGIESHQVGTHEFVDFCRRVGADPFYCVNFESDGRRHWARPVKGGVRSAGPKEAAEWVDYCNNPSNKERKRNGAKEPFDIKLWQIGNETSYDPNGFNCETAAERTAVFAKAMRKVDPDLKLIGWGDSDWAPRMCERAGENLDYIAYHYGYNSTLKNPPFSDEDYQKDWDRTWKHLMTGAEWGRRKLRKMRKQVESYGLPLAVTEGHYAFKARNRGELMGTWAMGVAYARIFNMYQRNGDIVKILTLSDFCGTRWMNNALLVATPAMKAYMLPVARVMQIFRHHKGRKAVKVSKSPQDIDITASRTGKKIFMHAVNTNRTKGVKARLDVKNMKTVKGRIFQIALPPEQRVFLWNADEFAPVGKKLSRTCELTFPPASVCAVELEVKNL